MRIQQYEIEILVNGKPVKEYLFEGKTYIEGRDKTEFSLRLKNNSSSRVLMVPTVDGLSILDGKLASYLSRGYVLAPYSAGAIDGWRTSLSEVSKFVFGAAGESYAEKLGKGGNQGVIGVAVFEQKPPLQWERAIQDFYGTASPSSLNPQAARGGGTFLRGTSFNSANFLSAVQNCSSNLTFSQTAGPDNRSVQTSDMGTKYGDQKKSRVAEVAFERNEFPSAVASISYGSRTFLEAVGVQMDKGALKIDSRAFPSEFCPPPTE